MKIVHRANTCFSIFSEKYHILFDPWLNGPAVAQGWTQFPPATNKIEDLNTFSIKTDLDLSDCKIGSSISCDGVCLTVTSINYKNSFISLLNFWKKSLNHYLILLINITQYFFSF